MYRTQLGVRGTSMAGAMAAWGAQAGAKVLADWTRRVAAGRGAAAAAAPDGRRAQRGGHAVGLGRRQLVHARRDRDRQERSHRERLRTASTRCPPGTASSRVLDPIDNSTYELTIPTREDPRKVSSRFPPPAMPSNFWGMQHLWGPENPSDPHNPMIDRKGRVWMTSKIRNEQPAWCREGSNNKFAQYYPLNFSNRQASFYDPATGEFEL